MTLTVHSRDLNDPNGFADAIKQVGRDKLAALLDARVLPLFTNTTFRSFQSGNPRRAAKSTPVTIHMMFTFSDEELSDVDKA